MGYIISGIQQIGVGIPDAESAWAWYRKYFGMDVPIFKERAEAGLMLPYTDGKPQQRYAILAINMQGGGGFEIWQYTGRTPQPASFEIQLGDLGLNVGKIKCHSAQATHAAYVSDGLQPLTDVVESPEGKRHFFVKDKYDNVFQVVESDSWFQKGKANTGGAYGIFIGVSDIDKALPLYQDILGYDVIVYDEIGKFEDFKGLAGGDSTFRRVLLRHSADREGAFAPMFGKTELELIEVKDRTPKKIYEGRLWGDLGFIHLCFDVNGMDALKAKCEQLGFPFTVDSNNSFDMGEAAGRFTYIEDPDGTLIEFVETHKVPVLKSLGWYLNLRKRNPRKALPRLVLKALGLNRQKG